MSYLYNNLAPITVALVASVVAWLWGGARGDLLRPVMPWLLVFMVEVLVCFPQRHHNEPTYDARDRVWQAMRKSWLFRISLILIVLLAIPFINNGLCPGCDAAEIAKGISPKPAASFLPFCVDRLDHLTTFYWFATVLLSVLLVHFSMLPRGRRLTLLLIVCNGILLSLLGLVQGMTDALGPFWTTLPGATRTRHLMFFSVFGYPNMAGAYFTLLFGIAMALWRDHYERIVMPRKMTEAAQAKELAPLKMERFLADNWYLIPALIFYVSALNTLSRAAIILSTAIMGLAFLHTLLAILSRMPRARQLIVGVWSLMAFGLVVFLASIFMPNDLKREVDSIDGREALNRVTGKSELHSKVALALWKEHPLFGCGGWGYKHLSASTLQKLELNPKALAHVGGANVHNDYMQFLVEHGAVVVGGLLLVIILLLAPVVAQWHKALAAVRFNRQRVARPRVFFVVPSAVVVSLVAVIAAFIHAFGDCPFRALSVLDTLFILIAAISGFMPDVVNEEMEKTEETPPIEEHHHHEQQHHHHHHHEHHHHEHHNN